MLFFRARVRICRISYNIVSKYKSYLLGERFPEDLTRPSGDSSLTIFDVLKLVKWAFIIAYDQTTQIETAYLDPAIWIAKRVEYNTLERCRRVLHTDEKTSILMDFYAEKSASIYTFWCNRGDLNATEYYILRCTSSFPKYHEKRRKIQKGTPYLSYIVISIRTIFIEYNQRYKTGLYRFHPREWTVIMTMKRTIKSPCISIFRKF